MLQVENCRAPSCVDGLPAFAYSSDVTGMPYVSGYDINKQLPQTINSRNFIILEITIRFKGPLILHTNIRSLSLHHEDLVTLCVMIKVNCDIIGVSETWNQTQKDILNNFRTDGYNYHNTKALTKDFMLKIP